MRWWLAVIVMTALYVGAYPTLCVRQFAHWFCKWLDRWFDLVGRWGGMQTGGLPLPRASDTDINDLPPFFEWLPVPKRDSDLGPYE